MRFDAPKTKIAIAALVVFQAVLPSTVGAGEFFGRLKRLVTESEYQGTEPVMGQDCAMECLAENIDWLEHHIDNYGSIVAKQPDIWGEARLTKHRDEYERIMFGELGKFNSTINASVSQQDGAFLAQAFALSAAASGASTTPVPADAAGTNVSVGTVTATLPSSDVIAQGDFKKFGITDSVDAMADPRIRLEPVTHLDQQSRYLKHLHQLRRINEGDDTSDSPGYSLNLVRIPVSVLPGKLTRQGFGAEITVTAEPVISDDLMPTTFHNLVVNDLVHLLGLPLVRVTEILQFQRELQRQADAERERAEKEVEEAQTRLKEAIANYNRAIEADNQTRMAVDTVKSNIMELQGEASSLKEKYAAELAIVKTPEVQVLRSDVKGFAEMAPQLLTEGIDAREITPLAKLSRQYAEIENETARQEALLNEAARNYSEAHAVAQAREADVETLKVEIDRAKEAVQEAERMAGAIQSKFANRLRQGMAGASSPAGRARQAQNPLNPSSIEPVLGYENIECVADFFEKAYYGRYIRWSGGNEQDCNERRVNLLDARKFLDAEIKAAYELLSQKEHICLFAELAEPNSGLAAEIRNGHFEEGECSVAKYRRYFFGQLHKHRTGRDDGVNVSIMSAPSQLPYETVSYFDDPEHISAPAGYAEKTIGQAESPVEALAWAIVVEAALLNERLNRDVRKLAKAKEAFSLETIEDHWFFLPDTAPSYQYVETAQNQSEESASRAFVCSQIRSQYQAANVVFKEYVRVRWPIHVFAVDPVNQEQNVADVSQRKRELQFALALGFQTGQVGSSSLTQFARELQTQVETVSLNRTIVGFGHGADTFGWRFYPRVQALNVPGTLGAIRETILGTSRDYDLRHRQIEPGQRECVAIVLMPSFVPYADFDVRTNWFKLTNPKNTALTMKDSLKLSRAVTAMRASRATCAKCQHLYREGELGRLFKRVDQLDRELPMQTQRSMVPYENTLGGFEMFNTGVTDLAPELIGWYGAPGINTTDNECGCYQGCSTSKAGCEDAASCKTLSDAIQSLNATLAESPIPTCEGKGTTLFLVGDNFSVHDTKVIAGGVCIPHVRLISRELMQITIPHCVNTVELCENGQTSKYVAVYVATPYGITSHLHVPVMGSTDCGADCSASVVQHQIGGQESRGSHSVVVRSDLSRPQQPLIRLASQIEAEAVAEAITLAGGISELSEKIDRLEVQVSTLAAIRSQPQLDLQVVAPNAQAVEQGHKWFDSKDYPMLHRFKVKTGEQWRNCRDSLPCN